MADPTLFAAPDAAAHGSAAGGALEVTLALLLVVGLIAVLAWWRAPHAPLRRRQCQDASRC